MSIPFLRQKGSWGLSGSTELGAAIHLCLRSCLAAERRLSAEPRFLLAQLQRRGIAFTSKRTLIYAAFELH